MLKEAKPIVRPVRVNPSFIAPDNSYPHYRLIPIETQTGRYYCLFFYVSAKEFLILEPKAKRHLAVARLSEYLQNAAFVVYETVTGAAP